jgi:hypothetical protein
MASSGLRTSIRLVRDVLQLDETIESGRNGKCLYAIVVMPKHEERRTASFVILHGHTEGRSR